MRELQDFFRTCHGISEIELVHETREYTGFFSPLRVAVNDFHRFGLDRAKRSLGSVVSASEIKEAGRAGACAIVSFWHLDWVRGVPARTEIVASRSWSLGRLATERASCGAECISKLLSFFLLFSLSLTRPQFRAFATGRHIGTDDYLRTVGAVCVSSSLGFLSLYWRQRCYLSPALAYTVYHIPFVSRNGARAGGAADECGPGKRTFRIRINHRSSVRARFRDIRSRKRSRLLVAVRSCRREIFLSPKMASL